MKKNKKQLNYWGVWGMCLIFLFATNIFIYQKTKEFEQKESYELFLDIVHDSETAIQNRMLFYEEGLWGGVGLFNASQSVERNEWGAYVQALKVNQHYPGINGIGYIQVVSKDDLENFVQLAREDDYPQFKITNIGNLDYKEDYIILFIEPVEINKEAVGLNIGSEANRRFAAEKARDSGKATITQIIQLVQDQQKKAGFLLLLPVYEKGKPVETVIQKREALQGWVYAPFVGENFLQDIINTDSFLSFSVYDQANITNDNLIYKKIIDANHSPRFSIQKSLELGNNVWTILWESSVEMEERFHTQLPLFSLLISASASIFLLSIISFLLFHQYRTSLQTEKAQSSLEESENRFSQAFQNAPVGMALVSLKGKWIQVNKALCDILGYSEEELLKMSFQSLTHPDDLDRCMNLMKKLINGEVAHFQSEKRYIHKKKNIIWVLLDVSLVRDRGGTPLYFVAQTQDITVRKKSDEQIRKQKESLEKLNKVMIGREMKMIELKKSVKEKKKKSSDS